MQDKLNNLLKILAGLCAGILLISVIMIIRISSGEAFLTDEELAKVYTVPEKTVPITTMASLPVEVSEDTTPKSNSEIASKDKKEYDDVKDASKVENESQEEDINQEELQKETYFGDAPAYSAARIKDFVYGEEEPPEKLVFLTFDDGPSYNVTPKVLDILKENGVHATFFYYTKGDLTDKKDIIERTLAEGNSIGLHSNSHIYENLYPNGTADIDYILEDLRVAIDKIRAVIPGFDTSVYRFPGGSISWDGMKEAKRAVREWGVEPIDWNTMTGDADVANDDKSPEGIIAFMDNINSADPDRMVYVVLMHDPDWNDVTVDSLQSVIDYYKERGFTFGVIK